MVILYRDISDGDIVKMKGDQPHKLSPQNILSHD